VAIEALVRIEQGGAYANLILPPLLERSDLSGPDRRFVTELVYGTTRMQRACDHLVDRFLLTEIEPAVRAALRLGAYQLAFLDTPAHAALDATVGAVSGPSRSVVNAVLRRVAKAPIEYPDQATTLSYPDWVVEQLTADLGSEAAISALEAMNRPAVTSVRPDGYVQDPASQLVADAVGAAPGELVVDLCAAPGGKATALAGVGATVVAADRRRSRVELTRTNAATVGAELGLVVADGRAPALRPGCADRVLIDAPCSGLGSLRRRPDARWRIDQEAPERLARLQVELTVAGYELLKPGGTLTYSVCTLTEAESSGVLDAVMGRVDAELEPPIGQPWATADDERISLLLPAETDGMVMFQLRRPTSSQ
jgi:16S rRNA (cytosine967-C5)-methyltransferase